MLLTLPDNTAMINSLLPHVAIGIGLSNNNGVSRFNAVFLCAKSQFIIMLDWAGSRKTGRLRCTDRPTCSVRLHDWPHVVEFKNLYNGVNLMTNYAKKLTNNVSQKTSLFNVVSLNKKIIAHGLYFAEALQLQKKLACNTLIKFDSMVIAGGAS